MKLEMNGMNLPIVTNINYTGVISNIGTRIGDQKESKPDSKL